MGDLFRWDDHYSVGVAQFDADHRRLLGIANRVVTCVARGDLPAAVGDVLDELIAYADEHFAREEDLMRVAAYPRLGEHHQQHKRLLNEVQLFKSQYIAGDINAADVAKFLVDWIVLHIEQADKQYQPHLNAQGYH